MIDTDNDGFANFAFCARVHNPLGDPTIVEQAPGSPIVYSCKDEASDRCASKGIAKAIDASTVCTVSTVAEHFPGQGDDGADTQALCNLKLTDLGQNVTSANIDLLNVCSYPSGSPNSNPFDCVVSPGAGFLVITKATTPANANAYFGFRLRNSANTANATATNGDDEFAVQGGATSAGIPILPGTYALAELMPTGWQLDSISCMRDGVPIGNTSGSTRLNVTIVQGATTVCTYTNKLVASQEVTFTVTVTNNSLESVTLYSLEDTEDPAAVTPTYTSLSGVGTCNSGANPFGSIAGSGGTYVCTFKRTISGSPGYQHKDKVRAVGKDNENNSDTKLSNLITVVIK